MANFNSFPHVNADDLNLDWLLEQYATFNDRIAEIQAHFDEVAENMAQQNAQYRNEILALFNNYKNYINAKVESVENAIEQVSDNVSDFVAEHMEEWQLEAMTTENNDIIIGEYDPEQPITNGLSLNDIIINNTKYLVGGYEYLGSITPENSSITSQLDDYAMYEYMTVNWNHGIDKWLVFQAHGFANISKANDGYTTAIGRDLQSEITVPVIKGYLWTEPAPILSYTSSNNYCTISLSAGATAAASSLVFRKKIFQANG